jgi:hypothetical protein
VVLGSVGGETKGRAGHQREKRSNWRPRKCNTRYVCVQYGGGSLGEQQRRVCTTQDVSSGVTPRSLKAVNWLLGQVPVPSILPFSCSVQILPTVSPFHSHLPHTSRRRPDDHGQVSGWSVGENPLISYVCCRFPPTF